MPLAECSHRYRWRAIGSLRKCIRTCRGTAKASVGINGYGDIDQDCARECTNHLPHQKGSDKAIAHSPFVLIGRGVAGMRRTRPRAATDQSIDALLLPFVAHRRNTARQVGRQGQKEAVRVRGIIPAQIPGAHCSIIAIVRENAGAVAGTIPADNGEVTS